MSQLVWIIAAAHFLLAEGATPEATRLQSVLLVSMQESFAEHAWPEVEEAVRAEFDALSVPVDLTQGRKIDPLERRDELADLARQRQAACAIRIIRTAKTQGGLVEIWIADRSSGQTDFWQLHLEKSSDPQETAAVAALRTVEAHRFGTLGLGLARPVLVEAPPPPVMPPTPPLPSPPPSQIWGLQLGTGLLASPGLDGSLLGFHMGVRWEALSYLTFELDSALTMRGKDIEDAQNAATFHLAAARAWVLWEIRQQGLLRPAIGVGGGVVVPWTRGIRSPDLQNQSDRNLLAYLGANAQLGIVFSRYLGLRLVAKTGILLPEAEIWFGDHKVARVGRPLFEGFAHLEVRLP